MEVQLYYTDPAASGPSFLELNQTSTGLLGTATETELKQLINSLDQLEIIYRLKSTPPAAPQFAYLIKQVFDFEARSHLTLRLDIKKQLLAVPNLNLTQYAWIDFVVVVLSIGSLLLTFKYIYEVGILYNQKTMQKQA